MEYIVIINKYTGQKYAYPKSRFSELPCIAIEDDESAAATGFGRHEMVHMLETGNAVKIGEASIRLNVKYETSHL